MRTLLTCLALALPTSGLAAGWTQAEGAYYAKLWGRALVGTGVFDADGEVFQAPGGYKDFALNAYAEFGATDFLTIIAFGNPFGYASYEEGDSTSYVGAQGAGLRLGRAFGGLQFASEFRYAYLPGVPAIGAGEAEGRTFTLTPGVASNRIDGEVQFGMGLPFGWWAAAIGGRAFDGEGIDPAVIGFAQLGWNAASTVTLDFHANLNQPLGEVEAINVLGAGQTAYLGLGLSGTWWFLQNWGLHLGVEGVAYAKSNASTPTLTFGFETRGE